MKGHVNMYGGSPLNRLSWLRPSHTFLNTIISQHTTRWLLFNGGKPLTIPESSEISKPAIALLTTKDMRPLLGPEPYFGQGKEQGEISPQPIESLGRSPLDAARHHGKPVVFLGVLERDVVSSPLLQDILKEPTLGVSRLGGTPYFAMEVSDLDLSDEDIDGFLKGTDPGQQGLQLTWMEPRGLSLSLELEMASIFAVARTMVDWNSKSKYCPACGSKTYSQWGGWKMSCSSLLPWTDNTNRKPCLTVKGLHNFTHPRTDGVAIMVTVDETGDKILLGRGKKFVANFYSAMAGFIEPGETFEDAVKREMWEEAGVDVYDIQYHSGQPWPFPANIMLGFYARADSKRPIRIDIDNELMDARWFTREEVLAILHRKTGSFLSKSDYEGAADKSFFNTIASQSTAVEEQVKFAPTTAIAGVLIADWAEGKVSFPLKEDSSSAHRLAGYL